MEEEPKGYRACLIPIAAFIAAGIIGNLLFSFVEEGGVILSVIVFIGFIAIIFSGMRK